MLKRVAALVIILGAWAPAPQALAEDDKRSVVCATLEACLIEMSKPDVPARSWPYGISTHDAAFIDALKPFGRAAIPGVLKLLKSPEGEVRDRVGYVLGRLPAVNADDLPALMAAAREGNGEVPWAIGVIGTPEAIQFLIDLVHVNPGEAEESQISGGLEHNGARATPYLLSALRCTDTCDRSFLYAIAHILYRMPPEGQPKAAELAAIVADRSLSTDSRDAALNVIAQLKLPDDPATAQVLVQAASESILREDALEALVSMHSKSVVRFLVADLQDPRSSDAPEDISDIARLGDVGRDAGGSVMPFLDATDWDTRLEAATALGSIGYTPSIPRLMADLHSPDWRLTYVAVWGLGRMHATDARASLQDLAAHHWATAVRDEATKALIAIDTGDPMEEDHTDRGIFSAPEVLRIYDDGITAQTAAGNCKSGRVRWRESEVGIDAVSTWPAAASPPNFALPDHATGVLLVGGTWLVGRDEGEFGGGLYAFDTAGNRTEILRPMDENILGLYRLGGVVVAVGGLAHMFEDHGRVYRVEQANNGTWIVTPLVELPSAPMKVGVLDEEHLAIDTEGGAVVVDSKGGIDALECMK